MLLVIPTQKGFQKVEVEHLKSNESMFSGQNMPFWYQLCH